MKICKDGRIWGQNNKEANSHLGMLVKKRVVKGIAIGKYIRTLGFRKEQSELRKGENHHNFGKPAYNKGMSYSVEAKNKISKATSMNNNPNWRGGISFNKYSPLFNKQLKERVRVRDNFICQICGIPELECKSRLDIHHIDYNKKNNNIDNLISLCRKCHIKTNYNRKDWTNKFIISKKR